MLISDFYEWIRSLGLSDSNARAERRGSAWELKGANTVGYDLCLKCSVWRTERGYVLCRNRRCFSKLTIRIYIDSAVEVTCQKSDEALDVCCWSDWRQRKEFFNLKHWRFRKLFLAISFLGSHLIFCYFCFLLFILLDLLLSDSHK